MTGNNKPRISDRISACRGCTISVLCKCGRRERLDLGTIARLHNLPGHLTTSDIAKRLRCRHCGRRGMLPTIHER